MSTIGANAGGAVYDRGYRPYDGARGRRGAATLALYKASMRRALGIRRSWRQKVAPFVLLGVVTIPAIVNVGIGYVTRNRVIVDRIDIITYRDYVGVSSALLLANRRGSSAQREPALPPAPATLAPRAVYDVRTRSASRSAG